MDDHISIEKANFINGAKKSIQISILPNLVLNPFLILTVKLECLQDMNTIVFSIKWPNLITKKTEKNIH